MLRPKYRKSLIDQYKDYLKTSYSIRNSSIDKEIRGLIRKYLDDGQDFDEAVDTAIREKRHLFSAFLDQFDSDSEYNDSEYEDSESFEETD